MPTAPPAAAAAAISHRRRATREAWATTAPRLSRNVGRVPEHAPQNAMEEPGEIARFYDRCSDLMRELLDGLAQAPDRPRTFPEIEDAIGWPRRRIASVLGGVARLRQLEFGGRRPYRLHDERQSATGRWELWMDAGQARAVRAAAAADAPVAGARRSR
jgi:hypothetical protein